MADEKYHLRRAEKEIRDRGEQVSIIRSQKIMTVAMCKDGEPYLVTLDFGFDENENCFYAHCAPEGKKVDFLRANPRVWGQVLDDRGYETGKCGHSFRCVMFGGRAEFVEDEAEKRRALELMMDQLEPDPAPLKRRLTRAALARAAIIRIRAETMTAKASPAPKKT